MWVGAVMIYFSSNIAGFLGRLQLLETYFWGTRHAVVIIGLWIFIVWWLVVLWVAPLVDPLDVNTANFK